MFEDCVTSLRNYIKDRTNQKCFPPWNWLFVKLLSLLSRYPSGVTKAIILAEIQQSWNQFSQFQGRLEGQKARKLSVDSVFESRHIGYESILEATVERIDTVHGTHTNIAILRDPKGRNTLGMYMHQKLCLLQEELIKNHTLRFTSCRLIQGKGLSFAGHKVHLLPSENVVILCEGHDLERFNSFGSFLAMDKSTLPRHGSNVKAEVADMSFEETVHFPNGQTSIKRCIKVVDSEGIHVSLCLWDEQLPMAKLFKEGDTLAIQQPFVVPNQDEMFLLEYGPDTVIFCMSHDPERELVSSQMSSTQGTPVSVMKDNQGMLDYSTFPEQIFFSDIRPNMTRVTIFCTITSVGEMKVFTEEQVSGHKFVLTARDCTQSHSITVFDHTRDYYHSLYPGQSIMLENVHTSNSSSSIALTLETNNFGRIWNVSAMPGWLATKCLFPPVLIRDIDKYDNCTCRAVITQVAKVGSSHTAKVHVSCQSEVEGFSGQFYCKKCGITYLNEMLNKPGQMRSPSTHWMWQFNLTLELHDSSGSIMAYMTNQTAQQLLQIKASQFAEHVAVMKDQILESVLAQECVFGISLFKGRHQIDAICFTS
ncbi:uncharacterized protein [Montipora capricornis]|uniref:uncharacterized protein n=1 Tax=Montipora capricornis TaxID=246305 RepID=UPI0035F1C5F9